MRIPERDVTSSRDEFLVKIVNSTRSLVPREVRYAIPEKEALAIFWGIQKFYKYFYGTKFTIQTDSFDLH